MRIGDNFAFHIRPPFPNPDSAGRQAIVSTFFLTAEARSICLEIFQRLADYPAAQDSALVLSGHPGVGKTHLLRYILSLLENLEDPAWGIFQSISFASRQPSQASSGLYLPVPADPSQDLAASMVDTVRSRKAPYRNHAATPVTWDPNEFAERLKALACEASTASIGLVAVDGISRRFRRIQRSEQLELEICHLNALVDTFSAAGALVVLVGEETDLLKKGAGTHSRHLSGNHVPTRTTRRLRRTNIAQVIAGTLASKDAHQRGRILQILAGLQERLPSLGPSLETMADLYPIHPYVFQALFELRAKFPDFAILQFVQIAIKASRTRPAEQLVTIDWLLDYILSDLQKHEGYRPLVTVYEEFLRTVIPVLRPQIQHPATALAKAILLLAVCDIRPATVVTLADALLLFDRSGLLPSYAFTSAILSEMELHGGRLLSAEGALLQRRYWLSAEAGSAGRKELLELEQFRLRIPVMLCDWFQSQFRAWRPQVTSICQRPSPSFSAVAAHADRTSLGLVRFKGLWDPPWTRADLAALEEESTDWILYVLSPFDRLRELDPSMRELSNEFCSLLIWRPDSPTQVEMEQLQELAGFACFDAGSEPPPSPELDEVRNNSRKILARLYVERGRFLARGRESPVRDRAEDESLEHLVWRRLAAFSARTRGSTPSPHSDIRPADTGQEDTGTALEWAALLTGSDPVRHLSPDKAQGQVIQWWATHVGLDSAGFSAGLYRFPESFRTITFSRELRFFVKALGKLEEILRCLNRGESSLAGAMAQVAILFSRDHTRLLRWRRLLEGLHGLLRWLPAYERAGAYLNGACATAREDLEILRRDLLVSLDEPLGFLEATVRDAFDQAYEEFHKGYVEYYCSAHDQTLLLVDKDRQDRPPVDSLALRNLEMLSGLLYANKSYLNRVHIIGKWIRSNRCDLPAREILAHTPRCYCGFNPTDSRYLDDFVSQINGAIRDGIDHYRNVLRGCKNLIIQELKNRGVDNYHSRQIAALLSRGDMVPLRPRSIEILNQVIQKHTRSFVAEVRRQTAERA